MSHAAGWQFHRGSSFDTTIGNTVGERPTKVRQFGGVLVNCLLDTGSQITAVSEQFFVQYIQPTGVTYKEGKWFTLTGANGLEIPYVGMVIMDVKVDGTVVHGVGILVTKDSQEMAAVQGGIPGILGTNVLKHIPKYESLFVSDDDPANVAYIARADTQLVPAQWEGNS